MANSAQKQYETITNVNFETKLKTCWTNSFKGAGKKSRDTIQKEYDDAVAAAEQDNTVAMPDQPILFKFNFIVYLPPIIDAPAQHRATQDRITASANAIQQEIERGTFDPAGTVQMGPGETAYTAQNYARTPMTEPPRRLLNPTARQFARLDTFQREEQERFDQLYPEGGSWTKIKVMLFGAVVDLPVDIASLRSALGLPHVDLALFAGGAAEIDRAGVDVAGIANIPDDDHATQNDLGEG